MHNAWGGPGTKIYQEAEDLLLIVDQQVLELTTEEGLMTWSLNKRSSVIDLTFISMSLQSGLIGCERADNIEHSLDQF